MFKDPEFQFRAAVDKRGRQVAPERKGRDVQRLYRLKDAPEWAAGGGGAGAEVPEREGDEDEDAAPKQLQRKQAKGGKGGAPASDAPRPARQQPQQEQQKQKQQKQQPAKGRRPAETSSDEDGGASGSGGEDGDGDEEDPEAEAARLRWARARGLAEASGSSSGSDEDGGGASSSDDEAAAGEEVEEAGPDLSAWGVGALAANPDEEVPLADETRRLAVLDLDWAHVRAVDVLAVLRSFVPRGGAISGVAVYPSDYGLARMAEESVAGPANIYKAPVAAAKADAADGDGGKGGKRGRKGAEAAPAPAAPADEGDGEDAGAVDVEALRLYERSKLRWFYAVVACDSAATALAIYAECDGMEFEGSLCRFDLRFVPDEQDFDGRQARWEREGWIRRGQARAGGGGGRAAHHCLWCPPAGGWASTPALQAPGPPAPRCHSSATPPRPSRPQHNRRCATRRRRCPTTTRRPTSGAPSSSTPTRG